MASSLFAKCLKLQVRQAFPNNKELNTVVNICSYKVSEARFTVRNVYSQYFDVSFLSQMFQTV